MKPVAVVILAAGSASRFGSVKQLAKINEKSMLQCVIDTCQQLGSEDLYLLLGSSYEEIRLNIELDNSRIIFNRNWPSGMASSIRMAVERLQEDYEGILFLAGDQPMVRTDQLTLLIQQWRESPEKICAAQYKDTLGIPAIFPREYYSELLQLGGDQGAKKLLVENSENLKSIDIPEAAVDIDIPLDLRLLAEINSN